MNSVQFMLLLTLSHFSLAVYYYPSNSNLSFIYSSLNLKACQKFSGTDMYLQMNLGYFTLNNLPTYTYTGYLGNNLFVDDLNNPYTPQNIPFTISNGATQFYNFSFLTGQFGTSSLLGTRTVNYGLINSTTCLSTQVSVSVTSNLIDQTAF